MKIYQRLFLFVISWVVMTNASTMEKSKLPDYYFLSVDATGVQVVVKLNGVSLASSGGGDGIKTEKPIATWLMPGENTLSIDVKALPGEDTIRGSVKAFAYLHDSTSDYPKPKTVYATVGYPEDGDKTDEKAVSKNIVFEYKESVPVKLWSEASGINTIDDVDKKAILGIVEDLRSALSTNNSQKAVDLQHYKIMEDAAAEGKDPKRIADVTKENYDWLATQKGLSSRSLKTENARFSIVSKNKLVYVTDEKDKNAVQLSSEGMYFEIPVYFANISGSWVLAR